MPAARLLSRGMFTHAGLNAVKKFLLTAFFCMVCKAAVKKAPNKVREQVWQSIALM